MDNSGTVLVFDGISLLLCYLILSGKVNLISAFISGITGASEGVSCAIVVVASIIFIVYTIIITMMHNSSNN